MKIANIDREIIYIFWTTWGISTKFSGKVWLTIILKLTNKGFTLSLEDIFFENPKEGRSKWPSPTHPPTLSSAVLGLIRQEKENFINNIRTHDISDNKTFWKTVKLSFSDKVQANSKITLIEKKVVSREWQEHIVSEKVISKDQALAEVFNTLQF